MVRDRVRSAGPVASNDGRYLVLYYCSIMHLQTVLNQLGYPMNQVKIYLASLQMGEGTIADIAELVKMPRTTVTELVAEMHKQGLMNYYTQRNRRYWVAENPDKLMVMVKEREVALKAVLPQLHAIQFESGVAKPSIRMYVGMKEVQSMLDDMIETQHNIMAVVSWDDWKEFFDEGFVDALIERRRVHFLRMRLITPKSELALALKRRDSQELRQTKFLPEHITLRRTSTFIYDSKVTLISLNRKQPTGILIQDPDVVHGQTIYFESLWHHSTDS